MTDTPSLPAQIAALRRAIETRDHQSEQFELARYDAEALRAVLVTLQQHERAPGPHEGHREPCYYCGEKCNGLAGDPGEWPVPFCHADDPGRVKWHHDRCLQVRLQQHKRAMTVVEQCRSAEEAIRQQGLHHQKMADTEGIGGRDRDQELAHAYIVSANTLLAALDAPETRKSPLR